MRIYTKTGDSGTSSLFSGKKVPKTHPRLKSYGTLDELNSHIGVFLSNLRLTDMDSAHFNHIVTQVKPIQNWLFIMGSHLACDDETMAEKLQPIEEAWTSSLEGWIDGLEEDLPTLKNFILPGGGLPASHLHVCRTVCRRAERNIVEARDQGEAVQDDILKTLNRLSDYFFVLSRWVNKVTDHDEQIWES